jgi:hypothetical protein
MFVDIHFVGKGEYDPPTTFEIESLSDVKATGDWVTITPKEGHDGNFIMALFNKDVVFSIFPRHK